MSNVCMDTVVFYPKKDEQKNFEQLKQAILACYPKGTTCSESYFSKIMDYAGIPFDTLHVRGTIIEQDIQDSFIKLYCDAAWKPMNNAYDMLSNHYRVNYVYMAEEPSENLYINSDINACFLPEKYKVVLRDEPKDGSFYQLFIAAGGDTDFYFFSEKSLIQWFQEHGKLSACSFTELCRQIDPDYVGVYQFTNPMEEIEHDG